MTHRSSVSPRYRVTLHAANLASPEENTPFGYNRKNMEVTGNWYFGKKSRLKGGYEGEIMDRSHRDVEHAVENGLVTADRHGTAKTFRFGRPIAIPHAIRISTRMMQALESNGGIPANSTSFQPAF